VLAAARAVAGLRRLTNEKLSGENQSPAWSPDGRQITLKSGADSLNKPGQYDDTENRFAVINADGSGLHLVEPGALLRLLGRGSQRLRCTSLRKA
jgi:hypothetical protein